MEPARTPLHDMNDGSPIGLLQCAQSTPAGVRQIEVPPAARALCTLARVDYEDAFLVEIRSVRDRLAEDWARAILEGAPAIMQRALRLGWSALGLQLGPTGSDGFVLGWEVRRNTPDFTLLGASSRLGLPAELLIKRHQQRLLFDTFVQLENHIAHAVWTGVEPVHRPIVRYVLGHARRRELRRRQP